VFLRPEVLVTLAVKLPRSPSVRESAL
jgi:hypothetical protein